TLIRGLEALVGRIVGVIGFVPEIPGQNAPVVMKGADDALDVDPQPLVLPGVLQRRSARTLHPSRIVDTGFRGALESELRKGIPAGIEEHEDGLDFVALRDSEKLVDAALVS